MRPGSLVAFACLLVVVGAGARVARAEPAEPARLETSGFVGIESFGDNTQLGNSWAPEQVPGTSPVVGARLAYVALPALVRFDDARALQLVIEAELAIAPAFTGATLGGGRMSYFAPVFGSRAHAMLRLAGLPYVQPHLVIGAGAETVSSSSPFMARDTDGLAYAGVGAAVRISGRWQLRADVRYGLMPARVGSTTSTYEGQLGFATTFGLPRAARVRAAAPDPIVVIGDDDTRDRDGDGIPDRLDQCPDQAETVNGVADDDGCPEADPDGDGIVGDADKCPNEPEDFDHFQDEDGCPDLDNDNDGIADRADVCPNDAETYNGYEDDDGCPDQLPAELVAALASANVRFEVGRARLLDAAKTALAPLVAQLDAKPALRVVLTAYPDKDDDKARDLAKRRVDAVKWELVDGGIAEDRVQIEIGEVRKRAAIEATLLVR